MKYSNGNLDYQFNAQSDSIRTPIPILQQEKAKFTTNPFVNPPSDASPTDNADNADIDDNPSSKINSQLSVAVLGLMDDCFNKPTDIEWKNYTPMILQKDNRFTYIFILLLFLVLFMLLIL